MSKKNQQTTGQSDTLPDAASEMAGATSPKAGAVKKAAASKKPAASDSTTQKDTAGIPTPTVAGSDSQCGGCPSATGSDKQPLDKLATHPQTHIKNTLAVLSGKGGVGKSLVAAQLAVALRRLGYKVGVLDADITGPTMARAFGVGGKLQACKDGIIPQETASGIKLVSTNMVLPDETTPVLWRGSIISNLVRQFWSEVLWGELDYLIIDMPPGTGDVALTIFQSLPIDGVVIVTAPQDLVSMIVSKAVNMALMMDVTIYGIIENMSYYVCPACGSRHNIFGLSNVEHLAKNYALDQFAQIPITPTYAQLMDAGKAEEIKIDELTGFIASLLEGDLRV